MQNGVLTFQMLSVKAGLLKDILSGFKFILKLEAFKHKHFGTNACRFTGSQAALKQLLA